MYDYPPLVWEMLDKVQRRVWFRHNVLEGDTWTKHPVPAQYKDAFLIANEQGLLRIGRIVGSGVIRYVLLSQKGAAALAYHRMQPVNTAKTKSGRPKKGTQPSTESLVLTFYEKHPDKKFWSSRRIAEIVPRSRTAIENTKAYKVAEEIRAATKAERLLRQARRKRPK